MRERWNKKEGLAILNNHLVDYPTAINTSYLYGFGSMAGLMLVVQILTGIFLDRPSAIMIASISSSSSFKFTDSL